MDGPPSCAPATNPGAGTAPHTHLPDTCAPARLCAPVRLTAPTIDGDGGTSDTQTHPHKDTHETRRAPACRCTHHRVAQPVGPVGESRRATFHVALVSCRHTKQAQSNAHRHRRQLPPLPLIRYGCWLALTLDAKVRIQVRRQHGLGHERCRAQLQRALKRPFAGVLRSIVHNQVRRPAVRRLALRERANAAPVHHHWILGQQR